MAFDYLPVGYETARMEARRARAYYSLAPYPHFAFKSWKTEERGAIPVCLPFTRHITNKSARWLFGRGLSFDCDTEGMTDVLMDVWKSNRMDQKMVSGARLCGQSGSLALKFSYDESAEKPVDIQMLDGTEYVRWYYDPHDVDTLLMARVQYPYQAEDGELYWHREDWTPGELTKYKPLPCGEKIKSLTNAFENVKDADNGKWEIDDTEDNAFGVIPLTQVRNIETGGSFGAGDLWGLWQSIDQINFAHDLANKHNQLAVWPTRVYIDLDTQDDAPLVAGPGAAEDLKSDSDDKQGQVIQLEVKGDVREHLRTYAEDLLKMVYDASGGVMVRPDEVTNKGNLTQAVLHQLYAPLIETTEEKRDSYGENGVCKFLETMAEGLANIGAAGWKAGIDVTARWPEYFELTNEELSALVERKARMVETGFTTHERAVADIADAEGVEDIEELLKEAVPVTETDGEGKNGNQEKQSGGDRSGSQKGEHRNDDPTED